MTSIEKVFNELEEQGIVFKSANNLLHISIDASDYLDIKRLAKEMHNKEIIDAYDKGEFNDGMNESAEQYYTENYTENYPKLDVSKGSGMSEKPNNHIDRTCSHTNCREVCPECQLPQQKISDEEIEKEVNEYAKLNQILIDKFAWMDAIKWYREQLKQ
jgi:hypothetical protein